VSTGGFSVTSLLEALLSEDILGELWERALSIEVCMHPSGEVIYVMCGCGSTPWGMPICHGWGVLEHVVDVARAGGVFQGLGFGGCVWGGKEGS
jgi:hypothetical protein